MLVLQLLVMLGCLRRLSLRVKCRTYEKQSVLAHLNA
jgi:hypothetical protein